MCTFTTCLIFVVFTLYFTIPVNELLKNSFSFNRIILSLIKEVAGLERYPYVHPTMKRTPTLLNNHKMRAPFHLFDWYNVKLLRQHHNFRNRSMTTPIFHQSSKWQDHSLSLISSYISARALCFVVESHGLAQGKGSLLIWSGGVIILVFIMCPAVFICMMYVLSGFNRMVVVIIFTLDTFG